jgi:hypothetical protein
VEWLLSFCTAYPLAAGDRRIIGYGLVENGMIVWRLAASTLV